MGELGGPRAPPPAGVVLGDGVGGDPGGVRGDGGLAGVEGFTGVILHNFWQLACEHGVRFDAGLINLCLNEPNVATRKACIALLANPAFCVDGTF